MKDINESNFDLKLNDIKEEGKIVKTGKMEVDNDHGSHFTHTVNL